ATPGRWDLLGSGVTGGDDQEVGMFIAVLRRGPFRGAVALLLPAGAIQAAGLLDVGRNTAIVLGEQERRGQSGKRAVGAGACGGKKSLVVERERGAAQLAGEVFDQPAQFGDGD